MIPYFLLRCNVQLLQEHGFRRERVLQSEKQRDILAQMALNGKIAENGISEKGAEGCERPGPGAAWFAREPRCNGRRRDPVIGLGECRFPAECVCVQAQANMGGNAEPSVP